MNTTVASPEFDEPQATPTPVRERPPTMTTDKAIGKLIKIRRQLEAKQKEQALELQPMKLAIAILSAWLTDDLNKAHVNSMRCNEGTAYFDKRTSATIENWEEFLEFVRQHEAWELLERRVSKLAAEAILEETKEPVPGVKHDREVILKVRRG